MKNRWRRPEFLAANLQRLFVGVRRHTIACVRDTELGIQSKDTLNRTHFYD